MHRGNRIVEVLELRRTHDRGGHAAFAEEPRQGDASRRQVPFATDRPYGIDDVEVGLVVERVRIGVVSVSLPFVRARMQRDAGDDEPAPISLRPVPLRDVPLPQAR